MINLGGGKERREAVWSLEMGSSGAKMHLPGNGKTLGKVLAEEERRASAVGARKKGKSEHSVLLSEEEASDPELVAAATVGKRRSRRLMNERFLRQLNDSLGARLTAESMQSLFKPPPFGERNKTAFERLREPENAEALRVLLQYPEECHSVLGAH